MTLKKQVINTTINKIKTKNLTLIYSTVCQFKRYGKSQREPPYCSPFPNNMTKVNIKKSNEKGDKL